MKQGKTEKAVFAKLSTQKVELGKMDDLDALVKQARGIEGDMVDALMEAKSSSKKGVKAGEKHLQNLKEIANLVADLRTHGNALGVDVTKIKEWRRANDFLNGNPRNPTNKMIERMKGLL